MPEFRTPLFAAGVAAFVLLSAARMASGEVVAGYLARSHMLLGATELIERLTPVDAVVGAPEIWAAVPLLTGRSAAPSAPFRPDPSGRNPSGGTPAEQFAVWNAAGLQYLFLEHEGRVHGPALEWLEISCAGSIEVIGALPAEEGAGAGRRRLVRIGGEPACRAVAAGPGAG